MKIGIGRIPASWCRMGQFRKDFMQHKNPASRLRSFEKGADIVEALAEYITKKKSSMPDSFI